MLSLAKKKIYDAFLDADTVHMHMNCPYTYILVDPPILHKDIHFSSEVITPIDTC